MAWKIGNVSITPVIELDISVEPSFSLPDATPKNLAPDFDWLKPHFGECVADTSPEQAQMTIRAFLDRVGDSDILVIGTHWSAPTPVAIAKHKTAWKVEIP